VEQLEKRLSAITVVCRLGDASATAAKADNSNKPAEEKEQEQQPEKEASEAGGGEDKDGDAAVAAAAAEVEGAQLRRVVGLRLKWADESEELLGSLAFKYSVFLCCSL
jgi:hypothetical protein